MNGLLKLATEAHGGVDRWNQLTELKAHLSVTGGIWHVKGRPDVLKDIRIELPVHEERLTTHFVGQNKRFVFTPQQVSVEDEHGHVIEKRDEPRRAFDGQKFETPWDDLHVAYFDSYALCTYLTIPFLYTYPGFVTEELPPWREDGEEWRPLRAVFLTTSPVTRANRSHTLARMDCCAGKSMLSTSWAEPEDSITHTTIAKLTASRYLRLAESLHSTTISARFPIQFWLRSTSVRSLSVRAETARVGHIHKFDVVRFEKFCLTGLPPIEAPGRVFEILLRSIARPRPQCSPRDA